MITNLRQEHKPLYDLDIFCFGDYYKKALNRDDPFSQFILDVKRGDNDALKRAADLFSGILPEKAYVYVIPSSKIDGTTYLFEALKQFKKDKAINLFKIDRVKDRGKKSTGQGDRDYEKELESISLLNQQDVRGKNIFLVDDISTTGVSFAAGKNCYINMGQSQLRVLHLETQYYHLIIII